MEWYPSEIKHSDDWDVLEFEGCEEEGEGVDFSNLYLSVLKYVFNSSYVLLSNMTVYVTFICYTAYVNMFNSSSILKNYSEIK